VNTAPVLWYPAAHRVSPPLLSAGRYDRGYPRGAVVHATEGAYGLAELDLARQHGEAFFLIDGHGDVHQGLPLDRYGSHAGGSHWAPVGYNVSSSLVGINVECAGRLIADGHGAYRTAWGTPVRPEVVRVVRAPDGNRAPGAYLRFTAAQEEALVALLLWLKANNPAVFDLQCVAGHDEVSPGRQLDPGGSLSVTMPEFRRLLEERFARLATGVSARSA
jgi:N-acetyl-anhydromuramyl-L-alanine amidase AmpD